MNSFVDQNKISSYSLALTEKLTSDFFSSKTMVGGQDIKNFTSVQQINFFILKNLFLKWKEETDRLKSPYFDYQNNEVQLALKALLNTLSNHILISKEFFKPLLNKAIDDTLLLSLAPIEYFERELQFQSEVGIDQVKELDKFIKINKPFVGTLLEKFNSDNASAIRGADLINYLKEVSPYPENTADVIEKLSGLLKLEIGDILIQPQIQEEEVKQAPMKEDIPETKVVDVISTASVSEENSPESIEPDNVEVVLPANENIQHAEVAVDEPVSLNEKFVKQEKTLYDLLAQTGINEQSKITDLRSGIPLNERFIFIKELFNDDPAAYALAVSEIEKSGSLQSALELLKSNYSEKLEWDFSNPILKNFIELVERRYS